MASFQRQHENRNSRSQEKSRRRYPECNSLFDSVPAATGNFAEIPQSLRSTSRGNRCLRVYAQLFEGFFFFLLRYETNHLEAHGALQRLPKVSSHSNTTFVRTGISLASQWVKIFCINPAATLCGVCIRDPASIHVTFHTSLVYIGHRYYRYSIRIHPTSVRLDRPVNFTSRSRPHKVQQRNV